MVPPSRPSFSPLGGTEGLDWDRFRGTFLKTAGRIVERLQSNAVYIASSTKRSFEEIMGRKDR